MSFKEHAIRDKDNYVYGEYRYFFIFFISEVDVLKLQEDPIPYWAIPFTISES